MSAVTAADKENMPDMSLPDRAYDLLCMGKHGGVCKACGENMTAVNAAHAVVVFIAAKPQCVLNDRCEVLVAVGISGDMGQSLVADNRCRVDAGPDSSGAAASGNWW